MNEWQSQSTVEEYATKAVDPAIGWYEYEVNFPDLVRLIPEDTQSILDFGCGPGEFTEKLTTRFPKVTGADMAPMLAVARKKYPNISFVEWDGVSAIPVEMDMFDLIFSKLTLQFIEDLDALVSNFSKLLNPHGVFILSVPNPQKTATKFKLDINSVVSYDDEIGDTGIKIHPIHRPQQTYVEVFDRNGFNLVETSEPKVPESLFEKYNVPATYKLVSSRLNMKFVRKAN